MLALVNDCNKYKIDLTINGVFMIEDAEYNRDFLFNFFKASKFVNSGNWVFRRYKFTNCPIFINIRFPIAKIRIPRGFYKY